MYTVTFDSNGGSEVESLNVNEKETVVQPKVPAKDGYDFAGWFSDSGLTTEYNFDTELTENLTFYAKWEV